MDYLSGTKGLRISLSLAWFAAFFVLLNGCGNTPKAKPSQVEKAALETKTPAPGLAWKATSPNQKQYIFIKGCFSRATGPCVLLSGTERKLIVEADHLLLENRVANVNPPHSILEAFQMPNQWTIKSAISPEKFQKLKRWCVDSLNVNLEDYDRVYPMILLRNVFEEAAFISHIPGYSESLESLFMTMGSTQGIPMSNLSRNHFLSDSFSLKQQVNYLAELPERMSEIRTYAKICLKDQCRKDITTWEQELNQYYPFPSLFHLLVTQQVNNWMPNILDKSKSQNLVVLVGAEYLPGKDGLLEQLKKNGFTMEPIQEKKGEQWESNPRPSEPQSDVLTN